MVLVIPRQIFYLSNDVLFSNFAQDTDSGGAFYSEMGNPPAP
jgi:hypothetical protein